MRSFIGLSIVTVTLLVMLGTLFLFWKPTSHKDLSATVINTPALAADDASPEPTIIIEEPASTTAELVLPEDKSTTPLKVSDVVVTPQPPTETSLPAQAVLPPEPTQPNDLDTLIHTLTNTSRRQNDLTSLSLDSKLSALAKARSEEMINENYFSHTSLNGCDLQCRFTDTNYKTMTWGENLAESTSYNMLNTQELAKMFMESWLKSNGHRENLLSAKFTHEGIGVAAKGGRVVVTVIFAAP